MKFKNEILMKHSGHRARDLYIGYEADIATRQILLKVKWIDTGLLEWFLSFGLPHEINSQLDNRDKKLEKLDSFDIELIVAEQARFSIRRIEREYEPHEPTLVMRLIA
jgi:hypothetical protein